MIYFDNAATTMVMKEVADGVLYAMSEAYGNPSSLHKMGIDAERLVNFSKKQILSALSDSSGNVIFTSGATESNNTAILGLAKTYGRRKKRVVTTAVEHPSVTMPFEKLRELSYEVVTVYPDSHGEITAESLISAVDDNTCLISCMLVNNETGYILPVGQAFQKIKKLHPECYTHCDCVQGFEKLKISAKKLGADTVSLSGHKIYAPKGIGALYIKSGIRLSPMMLGGGQQNGLRSGTEAVPMIYGFGKAVEALTQSIDERFEKVSRLKALAEDRLTQLGGVVLSHGEASPYILNVSIPGFKSETLLHYLESKDIFVSSGSACSKGKKSSILGAFGVDERLIDSVIRISFSAQNTEAEIDSLTKALYEGINTLARIK